MLVACVPTDTVGRTFLLIVPVFVDFCCGKPGVGYDGDLLGEGISIFYRRRCMCV